MQIKMKTQKLQEMVAKAVKGSSNNKMIPITSLMSIEFGGTGSLVITTTDASNFLKISDTAAEGTPFAAVVPTELFSKLVAKTTTEFITLTLDNNVLQVKGNGKYDIEVALDENGAMIPFPTYAMDADAKEYTITLAVMRGLLNSNKAALAQTMEVPCLTGYYFGDTVITTDSLRVCCNEVKVFETPVLIPSELMDLVSLIDDEKIQVKQGAGKLLFTGSKVTVYGVELMGIEDYPVDAINAYLQTDFAQYVMMKKDLMLNVLDRQSLFVSTYDQNSIFLVFGEKGLTVNSRKSNAVEEIPYTEVKPITPFACCIDIELIKTQVAAQEADTFQLWFGHEKAVKLVSGKTTQIISLMEDDTFGSDMAASGNA